MTDSLMQLVVAALAALSSCPVYFPRSRQMLAACRQEIRDAMWIGDPRRIELAATQHVVDCLDAIGEYEAENAWLKAAEQGVDDGFERWEFERLGAA